ncbi:MAG: ThiF family adenylyltransferase [Sedimentisphaerales bacterium]|nr:ThiF family adenylyltransferase [Sedimentisphaerales bacterium]
MGVSWIALYPRWYAQEVSLLKKHYPAFRKDEIRLRHGKLIFYGNLVVRPPGGAKSHPVLLVYPDGTPYEHPSVTPICSLPKWGENGGVTEIVEPQLLDCRHQMSAGNLCLFQRATRSVVGGDILTGIDVLRRAEAYLLGYHTGRWPPDTVDSELESHFLHVSDVLMADTFYEALPETCGRFFCIPDLRRLRDVSQRKWCPMIVTAMTAESPIIMNYDAREELARLYPWIEDRIWNSYDQMISDESSQDTSRQGLLQGYWWSLPTEPHPFHDGKGLLRELAVCTDNHIDDAWLMLSKTLGADMTASGSHLIGLRYPARRGGSEWLMLLIGTDPVRIAGGLMLKDDTSKRAEFERASVSVLKVHRLNRNILAQRNTKVVSDVVRSKTVALIGLGALGSKVAELLAQAGVEHFRLCDNDCLRTGNVARHIAGVSDFGAPKVNAVATRLVNINPYLVFETGDLHHGSAVESLDGLSSFIAASDLTVCTTADESVESVVNELGVLARKPVLYGRTLRKGSMGRVFLVRPGDDACKACLAHHATEGRRGRATPPDWIDIPEEGDEILYHECARPVIASSAVDLSFTANLIARIALSFLEGKDLQGNHWVWSKCVNREIDDRFGQEFTTVTGKIEPYAGCPMCNEPDVVELLLTQEVRDDIERIANSSPDAETGGVLIGYVADRRAIVLRCTGPGPNAVCTAAEFRRDVDFVQSELDQAATELGYRGLYVGEWHSHLMRVPEPSPRDIQSLFEISQAPNYLTRCPVMVIAGVTTAEAASVNLRAWAFPVSGRMYPLEMRAVPEGNVPSVGGQGHEC